MCSSISDNGINEGLFLFLLVSERCEYSEGMSRVSGKEIKGEIQVHF